jgi:hypothetical protein
MVTRTHPQEKFSQNSGEYGLMANWKIRTFDSGGVDMNMFHDSSDMSII